MKEAAETQSHREYKKKSWLENFVNFAALSLCGGKNRL